MNTEAQNFLTALDSTERPAMPFNIDTIIETEAEEVERLSRSPVGSLNHTLSTLPVTLFAAEVEGRIIELPGKDIAVVPYRNSGATPRDRVPGEKIRRNGSWWACVVVRSAHPAYPVGGHHLSIPEAELVRGREVPLAD